MITAVLITGMGGYPSSSQNLEIRTWYDLAAVTDNLAGNHILMNNLDSTIAGYEELAGPTANQGKGWQPIGFFGAIPAIGCSLVGAAAPWWYGLTGTFDGQGYEIRDVFINRRGACHTDPMGLFGSIDESGIIKNVGVMNVTVTGCESVGGLAGWNYRGTVSNCYATGSVTGGSGVGGLVGENIRGTVSNSYSTCNVTGNSHVGGLLGQNIYGTVTNSYYNCDEALINGEKITTIGALFGEDFDQWLANDRFLDVNEKLSQESGYYLINDVSDFRQLLAFGQDNSMKFRLNNDLDLGDERNFYIPYLAGEFDGNGHTISHLSFNSGSVYYVGLFGYLAPDGKITQVGVENINITSPENVGGLVGYNRGTVSNSYSTGSVTGEYYVGGLVGRNDGDVSDSHSNGTVAGYDDVGGLVGRNNDIVNNSYSTSSVTGESDVGGLVGQNWEGTVSNSYSTGDATGASWVGGLVGYNYKGDVSNSYFTGTINGTSGGTGGVVGGSIGTVSNSYSTGSIIGEEMVGGVVGFNGDDGTLSNSYSTGSVTGQSDIGGLVGRNWGTVIQSFWDTETSGLDTSDGGTGKTTAGMYDVATFSEAAWDIITVANPGDRKPSYIWNIVDGETYPFLSWES